MKKKQQIVLEGSSYNFKLECNSLLDEGWTIVPDSTRIVFERGSTTLWEVYFAVFEKTEE